MPRGAQTSAANKAAGPASASAGPGSEVDALMQDAPVVTGDTSTPIVCRALSVTRAALEERLAPHAFRLSEKKIAWQPCLWPCIGRGQSL